MAKLIHRHKTKFPTMNSPNDNFEYSYLLISLFKHSVTLNINRFWTNQSVKQVTLNVYKLNLLLLNNVEKLKKNGNIDVKLQRNIRLKFIYNSCAANAKTITTMSEANIHLYTIVSMLFKYETGD